jgi:hypothetical protein
LQTTTLDWKEWLVCLAIGAGSWPVSFITHAFSRSVMPCGAVVMAIATSFVPSVFAGWEESPSIAGLPWYKAARGARSYYQHAFHGAHGASHTPTGGCMPATQSSSAGPSPQLVPLIQGVQILLSVMQGMADRQTTPKAAPSAPLLQHLAHHHLQRSSTQSQYMLHQHACNMLLYVHMPAPAAPNTQKPALFSCQSQLGCVETDQVCGSWARRRGKQGRVVGNSGVLAGW